MPHCSARPSPSVYTASDPIVGFLPHDDHHAAAFPPACSDGSPFEKSCGRCRVARKNNKGARFMNDRYNVRGNGGRGNGARGDREGVTRRRFMETASSIGLGVALLAVPGVARAQSGPIKIGVMGPFTGPAGRTGEAIDRKSTRLNSSY